MTALKSGALAAAAMVMLATTLPAAAACPNTGLKTAPFVFVTAKGRFRFDLEVAATPRQQECGMMFRTTMARGSGMYFPFDTPKETAFWMENTPLSLDLIFLTTDKRVLSITAAAKPNSRMIIGSKGIAASVIELNAGEAARIGLKPGDRVER
jgi:hypothetical protein